MARRVDRNQAVSPRIGAEPRAGHPKTSGAREPEPTLVYTGPDTDSQLTALHHLERLTEKQVYTGPGTGTQLIALRYLERIALEQSLAGHAPATAVAGAFEIPVPEFHPREIQPVTARVAAAREGRLAHAVRELAAVPWPLYIMLGCQAVLSLRLIWGNTAFLDEAQYIWAGRTELLGLTTGAHTPVYASYFSGAPVIYPPLAGLADRVGGLAAARLLSLAFMLGATAMLWGTARALFGRRAALYATALFVILGSTQFLGSLATYDAMALFLLTLSVRLVVAARDRNDSTWLLIAATAALALANATKYATGIFDPVVIAVAVLTSPRGLKAGVGRGGLIATSAVGCIAILLAVGGPNYVVGLEFSTLARSPGGSSPMLVLQDSARWVGPVVAIAVVASALAWWRDRRRWALLAALALAGVLVPANQARIHTTVSLLKHVDFGAWFACIAAGYGIAVLTSVSRRTWLRGGLAVALGVVILVPAGAAGRAQAAGFTREWPDTTQLISRLRTLVRAYPGVYLAEDFQVPGYYLENQLPWQGWQGTWSFLYRPPGSAACIGGSASGLTSKTAANSPVGRAFAQAIAHQYFRMIMLSYSDTAGLDKVIAADMHRYGTYHVVEELRYTDSYGPGKFIVWASNASGGGDDRGASC